MQNVEGKARASRARAVKIILAEGDGPWLCRMCKKLVHELGRYKHQGMVHHKDEDPFNNVRENLEVLHSSCHHSHHHGGKTKPETVAAAVRKRWAGIPKSSEHRAKLSAAAKAAWAKKRGE